MAAATTPGTSAHVRPRSAAPTQTRATRAHPTTVATLAHRTDLTGPTLPGEP